jgi:hypothetical protein
MDTVDTGGNALNARLIFLVGAVALGLAAGAALVFMASAVGN